MMSNHFTIIGTRPRGGFEATYGRIAPAACYDR